MPETLTEPTTTPEPVSVSLSISSRVPFAGACGPSWWAYEGSVRMDGITEELEDAAGYRLVTDAIAAAVGAAIACIPPDRRGCADIRIRIR